MRSVKRLDDLRDVVTALDEGRIGVAEVEGLTEDALSNGFVTPAEALRELRSAVDRNTAVGIIARLKLESPGAWKRIAPLLAEHAGGAARPRFTEMRPSIREPVPVTEFPESKPQPAASRPQTSRGDRWVDPEPYTARVDDPQLIGQILGDRYRLDRQIGLAVMGTVYLGSDLQVDEAAVAVTLLRPEFRSFSEAMGLLRTEVRVTRMLRHPHIARVQSLNSDRLGVYLVTEHLEGRTLDASLQEMSRGLPLAEAGRIVADVGAALVYAHDLDVVHGDLQPANVFITLSGRSKLLNFGLARAAGTRNGRFDPRRLGVQSLAYASAEMLEGRALDQRDDVYSLACIIYSALSGAHPFDAHTAVEARNLALPVIPLPGLSKDQNAALAQALAFERTQRTSTVTELLASLGWAADSSDTDHVPTMAPFTAAAASAPASAAPVIAQVNDTLAATSALEPAGAKSDGVVSQDVAPPVARRAVRRGPGRIPLPSNKAGTRSPPPPPASRGYLMPILIVLTLLMLLAAGIGVYMYRQHAAAGGMTRSRTDPSPAPSTPPTFAAAPVVADSSADQAPDRV